MALVLAFKIGEDFYVNHERVVVTDIVNDSEFVVRRKIDEASFTIREGRSIELFKGVFLSVGARGQLGLARIAIEAPRSVFLLRGENYRANPPPKVKAGDKRI